MLLGARRNLLGSVIIFIVLGGPIAITSSEGMSMSSSTLIVSMQSRL